MKGGIGSDWVFIGLGAGALYLMYKATKPVNDTLSGVATATQGLGGAVSTIAGNAAGITTDLKNVIDTVTQNALTSSAAQQQGFLDSFVITLKNAFSSMNMPAVAASYDAGKATGQAALEVIQAPETKTQAIDISKAISDIFIPGGSAIVTAADAAATNLLRNTDTAPTASSSSNRGPSASELYLRQVELNKSIIPAAPTAISGALSALITPAPLLPNAAAAAARAATQTPTLLKNTSTSSVTIPGFAVI